MPPYSNINCSSLAISLLKSCLTRAGISCAVDYASIRFSQKIGVNNAWIFRNALSEFFPYVPEMIFAEFAGVKPRKSIDDFIEFSFNNPLREARVFSEDLGKAFESRENLKAFLDSLRDKAKTTLDETIERILSFEPEIVGLTSNFMQENASLAIMKRIKDAKPSVTTIMGGLNCTGSAGAAVLKKFPFVDYMFSGEADEVFADICRHILDGDKDFRMPYGLLRQGGKIPEKIPFRITVNMNNVPTPEADDYFAALKEFLTEDELKKINPVIYTEASRGCWWAEKKPCTFCGLHKIYRVYRKKTPGKIAEELNYLYDRYGDQIFVFTDCIMSNEARIELPKLLSRRKEKMRLVTEIKSNLTDNDVKTLVEAGFLEVQPGIESLIDSVLKLMNKGNSAIRHIALLKYGEKYSLHLSWNMLYGFPGEKIEDYEKFTELLPLIHHLPVPSGFFKIRFDRNNVYWENPEKYFLKLKPSPVYDYYLPDDEEFIKNYAYMFVDESEQSKIFTENPVYKKVNNLVQHWRNVYLGKNGEKSECLDMIVFEDMIKIFDTRRIRVKSRYELTDIAKEIYLLCNEPKSHKAILETLTKNYGKDEIEHCLDELTDWKLLLKIRDEFLSLAVERPQEFLFRLLLMNAG